MSMTNRKTPEARPGAAHKFAPFGTMGPVTFGRDTFIVVRPEPEGFVVDVETVAGRREVEWFAGDVARAVVSARTKFPGCRIENVTELSWLDWLSVLEDIDVGREEAEYMGEDDE